MKFSISIIVLFFSLSLGAQKMSPNKFISKMIKDDSAIAFTVPGWLIRSGGKIASKDLEGREKKIVRELTSHVKKLRFVVTENTPKDFDKHYSSLKNYMDKKAYEPLITVKDGGSDINLWADIDGDKIKNLFVSIIDDEGESVFLNIKSKISLKRLEEMKFYEELKML